jgi:hypothetical protein
VCCEERLDLLLGFVGEEYVRVVDRLDLMQKKKERREREREKTKTRERRERKREKRKRDEWLNVMAISRGGGKGRCGTSLWADLERWKRAKWNQLWVCMKDMQSSQ